MARPRRGLLALTVSLAVTGALARIAIVMSCIGTFGAFTLTVQMARHEESPALELMPPVTSGALAWSAGMMLAFAAAIQALKRDRDTGVRALLRLRGASASAYVLARVTGIAVAVAFVLGCGTLSVGIAAFTSAEQAVTARSAAQATAASLAYVLAFSATIAPLALATLGDRSRAGGYLWLLALVVLPDLFAPWTAALVPDAWGDVVSIPSALASVRGALMPGAVDVARLARALAVLATLGAVASLSIVRALPREGSEPAT